MIEYDSHQWYDHLLDIEGSMVREIILRVLLCVVWALIICLIDLHLLRPFGGKLEIPEVSHILVGGVLGLLLVFRTNASYDRFWEGRRLWGSMVNDCRSLARAARIWCASDKEVVHELIEWTAAFPWTVMHRLRGTHGFAPMALELDPAEVAVVTESAHPPLLVLRHLSRWWSIARDRKLISEMQLVNQEAMVQRLTDHLGGCERIQNTPIPYAYMVHLRRALIVYCFTLPFALLEKYGWLTLLIVAVISYVMFGIEEIGVEIENPFGEDENDLPLEQISTTITRNVCERPEPKMSDFI